MHVFVCTNERDSANPKGSCKEKGSLELMTMLKKSSREAKMFDVRINKSGCLGRCENGPACVIYPEGTWYTLPNSDEGLEKILEHIEGGIPSGECLMGD